MDALEQLFTDRLEYIIKFWFKAFNFTVTNIEFYGDVSWVDTDFEEEYLDQDTFVATTEIYNRYTDLFIIDKFGGELSWETSTIPTRWLFENFEKEIIDGKKLYEEKVKSKNEKLETSKQKEDDLLISIKNKLTKKEWESLSRKIK